MGGWGAGGRRRQRSGWAHGRVDVRVKSTRAILQLLLQDRKERQVVYVRTFVTGKEHQKDSTGK